MTLSGGREGTDNPWCDVAIEMYKISPLNIPNPVPTGGKVLGDHLFGTLERFVKPASIRRLASGS